MDDMDYATLVYGLSKSETLKLAASHGLLAKVPDTEVLYVEAMTIHQFVGDCGTLYISNAMFSSRKELAFLYDYASLSGFSTLICTLASDNVSRHMERYLEDGWLVVKSEASNRNPEKTHVILVKHINCVKKGY